MTEITRRTALAALGIPVVAVIAGCVAAERETPTPPSTPTPGKPSPTGTPDPTATPDPGAGSPGPSAAAPSYGPNGTHFPTDAPWLGEEAATELEVDADWGAIADAVSGLSAAAVASGAAIRVRPGTLTGGGFGSSRPPVLAGLGGDWARSVLIAPRDGYGSVTVTEGARIDGCRRLALFGFDGPESGLVLTECQDLQIGWGRWSALGITRGGRRIDLYELVVGFRRDADDTFGIRPTDNHAMTDIRRFGCAFGPSVKPAGDKAHCDTVQAEGTGDGEFGPFLTYDSVDFGSSNAAVLLHTAVSRAEFHHSLVLGESTPWRIFPLRAGDYQGSPNAFAGGCEDVRLYDSIVCGPIGRLGYTHVVGSTLSYAPQATQQGRVEGRWNVDLAVADWTADDIRQLTGTDYSPASLARFWDW